MSLILNWGVDFYLNLLDGPWKWSTYYVNETLPIIVETTQFFIGLEASKTVMTRLADDKSTGSFALWYSVWVVTSILVPFLFTTQKPRPNIRVFFPILYLKLD